MAFDRKKYRLVTGMLTVHCTLRWKIHTVGPSESAKYRKSGQEEESSRHILRKLYTHRLDVFESVWVQLTN